MFETLFGAEMPLAVRFFVAFLIMLGLIGGIAWAVRRFGAGRLGTTTRGRQPRLAVIDYATVDGRRRLILVRRDNVEHLLMIGGPSDLVVELNIVRAVAPQRDVARPPAGIEALPRAIPLPESGGSWPLQPESNSAARPGSRTEPFQEDLPWRPSQPETPGRHRDTLAAIADELSNRPAPQVPPRGRPGVAEPPQDHRAEPRLDQRRPVPQPSPPAPAPAAPAAPAPATAETPAAADQNLADMAQRLEAALRKPGPDGRLAANQARSAPMPDPGARADAPPPPPPRLPRAPEQRAARPEVKPNQNKTAIYDTLEQEMANLLGRPSKN
jgi:flagellar protein FliO/FliZ